MAAINKELNTLPRVAGEVADIASRRLRLRLIEPETTRALLAGDVAAAERLAGAGFGAYQLDGRERGFLERQVRRLKMAPERAAWTGRWLIAEAPAPVVAGHAGFHGPPEHAGRAEIGYTVLPPYRGRGYATEACQALTEWAFEQGEPSVFLSIRPDNAPSLAIARRLGYLEVGSQVDPEVGLELVFERRMT